MASGATINVQLKSGTNHFHGELYWFHNDNLFAAAPYFSTPGSPLPPNLDNDLGGTLTAFTGSPFSIGANGASLNVPGSAQRADQIKPHVAIYGSKNEYFDVTAFAPVTQARFGTAPYDSLYGPGARNLDAS